MKQKEYFRYVAAMLAAVLLCACSMFPTDTETSKGQASSIAYEKSSTVRSGGSISASAKGEEPNVASVKQSLDAQAGIESKTDDLQSNAQSLLQWDLSLLPYREMLTSEDQKIYDLVYSNIVKFMPRFVMPYIVTGERINNIVHAVYYDNPELFWLDSNYRYGYTPDGRVTDITIDFNGLEANFKQEKRRFEVAAQTIIDQANLFFTDVEKAKFVHDAIVKEAEYDLKAPLNQSAYSALVLGKSVCAGYSRAFQYIMMKLEIPTYYCVGFAKEDHAWNIIQLDGEYYNVDLSWDDPVGTPRGEAQYSYFNITDEKINFDHQRRDLSVNLPVCTGKKYSYNNVFGLEKPVREGGAAQSYRELGFQEQDVLESLQDYYKNSKQAVVKNGLGVHNISFLLRNEALQEEIYHEISNRGWFDAFVVPAARDLGLEKYSAEISVSSEELAEGYMMLTQTITLK